MHPNLLRDCRCSMAESTRADPLLDSVAFHAGTEYVSSLEDVRRATEWWSRRLSKWPAWCAAVRDKVVAGDEEAFRKRFLKNCKGKTAAVFNNASEYGWLPHPPARLQEAVFREAGVDGEIALMVSAATASN